MVIAVLILVAMLAAWIVSIALFIDIKDAKGYSSKGNGLLWFIGLFATPFVVGLYVVALPNRKASMSAGPAEQQVKEELPQV